MDVSFGQVGGVLGFIGGVIAIIFSYLSNKAKAVADLKINENTRHIEIIKAEAIGKAEEVKTTTEAETKRIDQLLDTSLDLIKNLQTENRQQREDMSRKDKQHTEELLQIRNRMNELDKNMQICIEERLKFKGNMNKYEAMYNALEAQFKGVKKYRAEQAKSGKIIKRKGDV